MLFIWELCVALFETTSKFRDYLRGSTFPLTICKPGFCTETVEIVKRRSQLLNQYCQKDEKRRRTQDASHRVKFSPLNEKALCV